MPIGVNAQYHSKVHPGAIAWAVQEPGALELMQELIIAEKPDVIVELGTCAGGLTLAMHETRPEAFIFSFDWVIDEGSEFVAWKESGFQQIPRAWFGGQVSFIKADILGEPWKVSDRMEARIGTQMLVCDNGNKTQEVRFFGPCLRPGELLAVHDWGEEIRYEDVAETLANFEPVWQERCEEMKSLWRFWRRK